MARGAGGLRGSGTRGRRAHCPAPALARAPRTPRARSAAAARTPAAIFPASRPARPRRAPARPRPALRRGRGSQLRIPIGPIGAGSVPGGGTPPSTALMGPGYRPPGADSDGGSRGSTADAAEVGGGSAAPGPYAGTERAGSRSWELPGLPLSPGAVSLEEGRRARPFPQISPVPSGAASLAIAGGELRTCPWCSQA